MKFKKKFRPVFHLQVYPSKQTIWWKKVRKQPLWYNIAGTGQKEFKKKTTSFMTGLVASVQAMVTLALGAVGALALVYSTPQYDMDDRIRGRLLNDYIPGEPLEGETFLDRLYEDLYMD